MSSLRIATWNIDNSRDSRFKDYQAKMAEVQADIWVLTETRQPFCPGEEFYCAAQSIEACDLVSDRLWTAIWVQRSLEGSLCEIPTTDAERTACARLDIPKGPSIFVYATVLPWRGSKWYGYLSAGGIAFSEALAVQLADWSQLRSANPDAFLCVAGDFNQDFLATRSYYNSWKQRQMLKESLDNVGLACLTGEVTDPDNPKRTNIDHICIGDPRSQISRVVRVDAISPIYQGKGLSDHFIVYADVCFFD